MKMITAVVNKKDSGEVCDTLTKHNVPYTKLATQGGFLRSSNTTLLIGVEDENLDSVLSMIRRHCSKRQVAVPLTPTVEGGHIYSSYPVEITVGGAIVFVTDVTYFEKM